MTLAEIIALTALVLILGGAVGYIIYSKRRGSACAGCPYSKGCKGHCGCGEKNTR